MAVATEIESANGVTAPIPAITEKRKPGRPPKVAAQVDTEPDILDATAEDESDWQLHVKNLSEDDWSRRIVYCVRIAPTTEKRSAGRKIPACTYARPFDFEDLKKEHGSGVYRLDFLVISQPSGKYRRYRQDFVDIIDSKFPPNLPYGEWVDRPENEAWKWAGPMLLARDSEKAAALGSAPPTPNAGGSMYPPGFNMDKVYDRAEQGMRVAFELAKQLTPPPKDDGPLTALVTKLLEVSLNRPEPPKPDTSATDRLFKMMDDQLKETRLELRELRNKPDSATSPNILTQVKELRPVLTEFVEIFAAKNGGDQPWWAGPLEKLMEGVGEAIPSVVDMMKSDQRQRQSPQWNPPQPGIAAPQTQTAPPPQGPPPHATATATEPPPDQPEVSEEQKQVQAIYQKWGGFIVFISPQMLEQFKLDEDGHGGYHFRDWFVHGHGMFKWAELRKEIGPSLLSRMIGQHPVLNQEMSPEQDRLKFFTEFCEPEEDDDDEEDGTLPIELGVDHAA